MPPKKGAAPAAASGGSEPKHVCHLSGCTPRCDVQSLLAFPALLAEEPVLFSRIMALPNGKTVKVDDKVGHFVVTSAWNWAAVPCIAHFSEASKRSKLLVVAFADYDFSGFSMNGTALLGHEWPLKSKKPGKVQQSPKEDSELLSVQMEDAVRFEEVVLGSIENIDVGPVLGASFMLRRAGITSLSKTLHWCGQPLVRRVEMLKTFAVADLQKKCKVLAETDAEAAKKSERMDNARLDALLRRWKQLDLASYTETTLQQRVTFVQMDKELAEGEVENPNRETPGLGMPGALAGAPPATAPLAFAPPAPLAQRSALEPNLAPGGDEPALPCLLP